METNQRVSWEVLVSINVERVNNYDESVTKIPLLQARAFHGLFDPCCTIKQRNKQRAKIWNSAFPLVVECLALLSRW